ncbi:MAG: hypothetical protein U0176_22980 [Bacteroidia bacterium]
MRDYDLDIYAPTETVLLRYKTGIVSHPDDLQQAWQMQESTSMGNETATKSEESKNYHQVGRMTITVKDGYDMVQVADVIRRMMERRHNGVIDTEVKIPEELLPKSNARQTCSTSF